MARLLVARPREQAEALAETLRADGHAVIVDPMLGIRFLDVDLPPLDGVQAILLTSKNGARALARATERRDIRILAVGDATAEAARGEGFTTVESAGGDAEALIEHAGRVLSPDAGRVIHVSGFDIAEDVAAALASRGFEAARIVGYEAETASLLSDETQAALKGNGLDAVLLHSPRAAKTLAGLIEGARLEETLDRVEALALSEQVAAVVRHLPWARVRVAEKPNEAALLALIADLGPRPEPVEPPREVLPPPVPAVPPPKSGGGMMAGLVAGLIAGAAAGGAVAWFAVPYLQKPAAPREDTALLIRMAKLESALAAAPAPVPAPKVDLGPLESRLKALESRPAVAAPDLKGVEDRLAALESRPLAPASAEAPAVPPELVQRLAEAERRVGALQARMQADAPKEGEAARIALVLAASELGEAVRAGAPYGDALQRLSVLLGPKKGVLDPLAAHAAKGVATLADLQERFPAVARSVVQAEAGGEDEGWIGHVRRRLASAVTVRRTGEVAGDSVQAVVARAEVKVRQRDIAGAAQELDRLTGKPAEAAATWLAAAKASVLAERTIDTLKQDAFRAAAEARR